MAFVVVLFVNASDSKKDTRKAKTEVKKAEAAVPCSAACQQTAGNKAAKCDPATCKEMNCELKCGNCDPATCPAHKEGQAQEVKACGSTTAPCAATCQGKTGAMK